MPGLTDLQVMPAREGAKRDIDRAFDLLRNVLEDERRGARTIPITEGRRSKGGYSDPTAADALRHRESTRLWKALREVQQIAVDWQLTYGLPRCASCDGPVCDDERAIMYGNLIHDRPACRSKAQRRHARNQRAA